MFSRRELLKTTSCGFGYLALQSLFSQTARAAAEAGLQQGDIVLSANGTPVSSVEDLRNAIEKSKGHIALLVQRGDARLFVPVRVG